MKDIEDLKNSLKDLGIQASDLQDVERASIYVGYLQAAKLFFGTAMNASPSAGTPGLGRSGFTFVKNAVTSPSLLLELAKSLDLFLGHAVDMELQYQFSASGGSHSNWTYSDYFINNIFNSNVVTYTQNISDFKNKYPTTAYALDKLYQNFTNNILECCQRVINDRDLLESFYEEKYPDNLKILALREIKSSGSDFHKGGKQVLFLTFQIVHSPEGDTQHENLKVVYKPSDLEVDCMISGNSDWINATDPGFQLERSLVEIYNDQIDLIKRNNPGFTGEKLDTYGFLPRNYMSVQPAALPLPIKDAYGYIEYLNTDVSGTAYGVFGYYPFGNSDNMIFKSQNERDIIQKFYRKLGALSAIACTFSITDLHLENVRVRNYTPYLIDLEVCLTSSIASINDTNLIDTAGGINRYKVDNQDFKWITKDKDSPGSAYIDKAYLTEFKCNRLWQIKQRGFKQLIHVDETELLTGLTDGLEVLKAAQIAGKFNNWFSRLNNVIVRYLPYGTSDFKNIIKALYFDFRPIILTSTTPQLVDKNLRIWLGDDYNTGMTAPEYLVLRPNHAGVDYLNLDIPAFYHRIGTQDIVNSRGELVDIPTQLSIDDPATTVTINIGRTTFFADKPTDTNVNAGQVLQLAANDAYPNRVASLQNSIRTGLSSLVEPTDLFNI